jgi:hypothetical protein
MHNAFFLKNTLKIDIFKFGPQDKLIAEWLDFKEFVERSDAVYKCTREATTDQRLKRKALYIGFILDSGYP